MSIILKYFFLFILFINVFVIPAYVFSVDTFKTHFNLILPLTYSQLYLQFPENKLTDITTLDISMIANDKSPPFWPRRIPFSAGISDNQRNLFYYQFEPLGYSKLIDIPISDPPIYDVAITHDGSIFSITSANLYTHHYDFKSKSVSAYPPIAVNAPLKCVANHKSRVSVLYSNSLTLYRYRNMTLSPLTSISNKINAILADYTCINVSINPKGYILVITQTDLLFFSPQGILLTSVPNTPLYEFADFTSYGDYLLGSSTHTNLAKYTASGFFLFKTSFLNPSSSLSDLIIYQPYGNLCLISDKAGAYYSMNTSLTVNYTTYTIKKQSLSIDSQFLITFPSLLTVTVLDSKKNIIFLEKNKKLVSGNHQLSWDNLNPNLQNKSIHFTVKALYSRSNSIKKASLLTKKL
ncbi:hypothetical protein DID74_01035 [Candidatus Marinamargulisbacteria bacterium SCGC AG-333-B06]|nr:hypothetical protein DID74_01035 [Candidatus Marinamargulisbacteria bacterium SCGC AG-333-B06]